MMPDKLPENFWCDAAILLIEREPDPDRRAELREAFEYRAAICQYEGGLSRQDAERVGFHELRVTLGIRIPA